MKLKSKMTLMELGTSYVAVPVEQKTENDHYLIRLNETGKSVWEGLTEGLSAEAIAERLTQQYDVELDRAMKAVQNVIKSLREGGLLEE